LTTFQ